MSLVVGQGIQTEEVKDFVAQKTIEDEAPESSSNDSDPDTTQPSAISELQLAFGSILTARKDVDPVTDYSSCRGHWHVYQTCSASHVRPPYIKPKWTGFFNILAFPREIRDRIYFFYLNRPDGIKYDPNPDRYFFPFDNSEDFTSLYLTCRQVCHEALEVFYRFNHIKFDSGHPRYLQGMLRLFPDKSSRLIQRVRRRYEGSLSHWDYSVNYIISGKPGDLFIQILRDAHVFKSYFPKLREYTVAWEMSWQVSPEVFAEKENMQFDGGTESEKVAQWMEWMRCYVKERNVVPPAWVRFEFLDGGYGSNGEMRKHQEAINEAYKALVIGLKDWQSEDKVFEESRRVWLAELEEREKRRRERKGKRRGLRC